MPSRSRRVRRGAAFAKVSLAVASKDQAAQATTYAARIQNREHFNLAGLPGHP